MLQLPIRKCFHYITWPVTLPLPRYTRSSAFERHVETMSEDREVNGSSALRTKSDSTKIVCPATSALSVYSLSRYLFFAFTQLIGQRAFAPLLWSISRRFPFRCRSPWTVADLLRVILAMIFEHHLIIVTASVHSAVYHRANWPTGQIGHRTTGTPIVRI